MALDANGWFCMVSFLQDLLRRIRWRLGMERFHLRYGARKQAGKKSEGYLIHQRLHLLKNKLHRDENKFGHDNGQGLAGHDEGYRPDHDGYLANNGTRVPDHNGRG